MLSGSLEKGTSDVTASFNELVKAAVIFAKFLANPNMSPEAARKLDSDLGRNLQLGNRRAPEATAAEGSA